MTDFDVCAGTGDVPTPLDNDSHIASPVYTPGEIKEMEKRGYVMDSTGKWYDPNDYIDCLYADW